MKKGQKGITLIALIITIMVMLILVGVTINVALNGGIFDRAKDATQKTSREVSREQIVAAMIGAYDNNGNFVKANIELPEETKWCTKDENYLNASGEGNYVVTKNNEKFYVNPTDGTVLDEEPQIQPIEVDDLIPTEEEKKDAEFNSSDGAYTYEFLKDILDYIEVQNSNFKFVQINYNGIIYIWTCNKNTAEAIGNMYSINEMQENKWYAGTDTFQLYEGTCPIEFIQEQLQDNTYLKRINDSFKNAN